MKKYDKEFKKEAIRKYLDGQSIAAISRETGVAESALHRWKLEFVRTEDGEVRWSNKTGQKTLYN